MLIKCRNRKCGWHGQPNFEEHSTNYVKVVCPKCHAFIKFLKQDDVPDDCTIKQRDSWWDKIQAAESQLRPAYILQKELLNLRSDFAALQVENVQMKEIIEEATNIITEAMEREGLVKHVPKWMLE